MIKGVTRVPLGVLVVVTSCVLVSWCPVVTAQGPYHTGTTSWTLFSDSWPVREVFLSNWSSTVHGASTAWVLDMYASWCGHCQRFAPTWKRLAANLKSWSHVVQFGALACSHPDAEQLCIDQSIIRYPTIKMYPPGAPSTDPGTIYMGDPSEAGLRMGIVEFLSHLEEVPSDFPDLRPIRSTVTLLHTSPPATDKVILLLAENITESRSEDNYLGRYVILDVSAQWRRVVMRRIEAADALNLGVREFPSLHQVNPTDGSLSLIASHEDRRGFVSIIRRQVLQLEDEDDEEQVEVEQSQPVVPAGKIRLPDGAHDQDLESGLFFSLWHEVALHKNFRGSRLAALKTYVHYLAELLPVRAPVKRWLHRLDSWLADQQSPLTRTRWIEQLDKIQDADTYIPKRVIWTGCQGHDRLKRGYPCSLWTTFHALSVAAYNQPDKGISPKAVLLAVRAYVNRYFSCAECSEHFMKMSSDMSKEVDETPESGVLWLWLAHNKVNKRLHGDPTEDALNPKMQFPTYTKCPSCHVTKPGNRFVDSVWDQDEVLAYLVEFYSDNIIRDALPFTYIPPAVVEVTQSSEVVGAAVRPTPFGILVLIGALCLQTLVRV